jgi:uncharacterized DUF497 family protein
VNFEWDEAKDLTNRQKHDLGFAEAAQLFESGDEHLDIFDVDHSESEDRFIAIGPIARGLIVVVYIESEEDTIRIISARKATRREQLLFREHMNGIR